MGDKQGGKSGKVILCALSLILNFDKLFVVIFHVLGDSPKSEFFPGFDSEGSLSDIIEMPSISVHARTSIFMLLFEH